MDRHRVTSMAELEAIYGEPGEASLVKEVDRLIPEYAAFVRAAPFLTIATSGSGGLDCSPRGDPPGFVEVRDDHTLVIPDRRGNNRIDTLRNLVVDPRVALLFMIPGVSETVRINGRASISADPALLERLAMDGKLPRTALVVTIERVYFQCSKALVRSRLWDPDGRVERRSLPSAGQILAACSAGRVGGEAYDLAYPERLKATIY